MVVRALLVLLSVAPVFVSAQEAPERDAVLVRDPVRVVYDVEALLMTDLDAPLHPLVPRLHREPGLAQLALVASRPEVHTLRAQFVFHSLAAYEAWRADPGTVRLFEDLSATPDGYRTTLTVRRLVLARALPDPAPEAP